MGGVTKVLTSEAFTKTVSTIGTIAQATGQLTAGRQEAQVQRSNAKINQFNATISRQAADLVEARKVLETKRLRKQKRRILSTQRAAFSKAGVIFEGSPSEVLRDTESELELDILINKVNRDVEKNKFLSEARVSETEAGVRVGEARIVERTGQIKAVQTILTGLSRF